jgi:hypothetical protein
MLVCHLVLQNVLRQEFASTAYATNVHIKSGSAAAALAGGRLSITLPLRVLEPKRKRSNGGGGAAASRSKRAEATPATSGAAVTRADDDDDDDDAFQTD